MSLRGLKTYKQQLLVLIVTLIGVAQGATIVLALSYLRMNAQHSAERELRSSQAMLLRELRLRQERMESTAELLVSDFGFKAAVASRDATTIRSALRNHAQRIGATVALLYAEDGRLIAATSAVPSTLEHAPPTPQTDAATPLLYAYDGMALQFAVTSVRAPEPIATVAFGFPLDATVAHQLALLVGMDVAFVVPTQPGAAANAADALQASPRTLSLTTALPARSGRMELVQRLPMDRIMASYRTTRDALSLITALALLGAIVIAWLAGRSAAKPVERLAKAAQRIEAGEYEPVLISGAEEFTHLARSFNGMQAGLREREERIRYQSLHDALTDLWNRTGLRAQLAEWLLRGEAVTVLLFDLHRFRDLNASMERHAADELLRAVALRLRQALKPEECAARLGADQFALLLRTAEAATAERAAREIIEALRRGLSVAELRIALTVRAGISSTAVVGSIDADDLLRQADFALLEAKEQGIALVRYQAAHDAEHQRGVMLVAELRRALANDQLSLAFQPVVRVTDGELTHFEALVRWTHPTLGVIAPAEFIPLAERSAMIGELTHWVIGAVLRQLQEWERAGFRARVAMNLSAGDVTDMSLPQYVLQHLGASGIGADRVIFEVTESAIMRDPPAAVTVMQQLRAAGIRFALDDFGTGHSSLAQLHTLPLDELKIDRSFVSELGRSERSLVIVRSTTELAHGLGLHVVAEGVETAEAWSELLRLGCDYAQGYFISRPLPAAAPPDWLQQRREQMAANIERASSRGELVELDRRRANQTDPPPALSFER
ncbi:MAG: putative bifunctional diguanylate cyclase/phosphodiesterase [Steroidobacteraceae bacterium]